MLDRLDIGASSLEVKGQSPRPRRQRKPKICNGICLAALQAITAARGFLIGTFPSVEIAAMSCGAIGARWRQQSSSFELTTPF